MICKFCGTDNPNNTQFCINCGKPVTANYNNASVNQSGNSQPPYNQPNQSYNQPNQSYQFSTGAEGFVSSDETWSYSLRNGWIQNLSSGEGFIREDAVITNKRLYYSASSGLISRSSREEIVEIEDITGTKIFDFKPYSILIFGLIIFVAGLIFALSEEEWIIISAIGLPFIVCYFIAKKSLLRIEYAGGCIHFSVKRYGLKSVRAFQRQIYAVKEKIRIEEKMQKGENK